ncbi:MAG: LysM peptidoglycan-binding domain-containing protein [Anaerolineae bacterium]|jgi:LysM repeat protein|nr:LysM peptidoglycan-binding domain-containing protein [Anaerolineae bacterium]MCZ7551127.1 LysM peptidoglycan-binding domain-containing protein [Anaerolineales bacterium]
MPEITLSLPAVVGLLALFLATGAILVYLALNATSAPAAEATASPTVTLTETPTLTSTPVTPTATWTPEPSPTPLVYTVQLGDNCGTIAYSFGVSIQSIVLLNNLPADCSTLYENQKLLIPQPTPTATAQPTSTLSPAEATDAACQKLDYTVQENDTLSSISLNYNVPADALREYNGLVNDVVRFGQVITIPLCRRNATPGPSPTPTLPPPYPAVNLLLPPDGSPFGLNNAVIALQWAAVGALRENEAYAVNLEDITQEEGRRLVNYVRDTKFVVPASFLPNDGVPHVIRWWIVPVRQIGTDNDGNPIWDPAGAVSNPRVFTWLSAGLAATPTP